MDDKAVPTAADREAAKLLAPAALAAYMRDEGQKTLKTAQALFGDAKLQQQALLALGKAKDQAFLARLNAGEPQAREELQREILRQNLLNSDKTLASALLDKGTSTSATVELQQRAGLQYDTYVAASQVQGQGAKPAADGIKGATTGQVRDALANQG